jgi:hypothetical protein
MEIVCKKDWERKADKGAQIKNPSELLNSRRIREKII